MIGEWGKLQEKYKFTIKKMIESIYIIGKIFAGK